MTVRTNLSAVLLAVLAATALPAQIIQTGAMPLSGVVSRDGKFLLTLNAGQESPGVSVIELPAGKELSRVPLPDAWLGLTFSRAGDKVYASGGSQATVYEFSFSAGELKPARAFSTVASSSRKPEDFIGDVQLSPDGRLLYAAELYRDSIVVINPQSGLVIGRYKTGRRPFRILFHPSGRNFYVSSWADGTISRHETSNGNRLATTRVGPHTTDMLWRPGDVEDHPELKARLFVSSGNTNSVYVLGADETGDLSRLETLGVGFTPTQPAGMTPAGLGASSDGSHLYVACSDAGVIAVADISGVRSRLEGFIAAGDYPTMPVGLADGRIAALNSTGVLMLNTRGVSPSFSSTYTDQKRDAPGLPPNGPLRHVIYVLNGGMSPNDAGTPNRNKLAREFGRIDNFRPIGSGVEEGLNWATAAIAPAYTRLLAPNSRAGRRARSDYEWQETANSPPAGYLWTNAAQAGIKLQNFGLFVSNLPKPGPSDSQISDVHDPVLLEVTQDSFRGRDPAVPDTSRARAFIASLREFEKAGSMPQLLLVRLGDIKPTPSSSADNDAALGQIVEAVSKSRFWPDTVIFIVPEAATDPQGLAPAWIISPFAARHAEAITSFDHTSILRTIEMILALHPMTTFDASSAPMFELFTETADTTPFSSVPRP